MNRFLAIVAVFGAFGTVALALALMPEAQTSASHARALPDTATTSEPETAAPAAVPMTAAATPPTQDNTFELAPLPQRAKKADRLARSFRTRRPEPQTAQRPAVEPTGAERRFAPEAVSAPVAYEAAVAYETAERDVAVTPRATLSAGPIAPGPEPRVAPKSSQVSVETSPDASVEDLDEITEVALRSATDTAAEDVAEAAEDVVEDVAREDVAEESTQQPAVATRSAAVTTDVNMRARPANEAAVVVVVPRRSEVEVIGCDYWCEVMYAGKRGFIYKGFVRDAS